MKFSESKKLDPIQVADLVKRLDIPKFKGEMETRRVLLVANLPSFYGELKESLGKRGQKLLLIDCKKCANRQELDKAIEIAKDQYVSDFISEEETDTACFDGDFKEFIILFKNADVYVPKDDEDWDAIHCLRTLVKFEQTPTIVHVSPDAEDSECFWNEMRFYNSNLCSAYQIL